MQPASRHECHIYAGPPSRHLPALAEAVRQRLSENYRCLYLNSPTMVAGMGSYLAAIGVDVELEMRKRSLVLNSDQSHVQDGVFDAEGMIGALDRSVQNALADGYAGLFATGDMGWELGSDRDAGRLVRYESLLEGLFHKHAELRGVCQYHADTLPRDFVRQGLVAHRSMFINETLSIMNPHYLQEMPAPEAVRADWSAELEAFLLRLAPGAS